MLEQAKQLSGGQVFVVNWISGIVHAQLPSRFHEKKAAQDELAWCVANAEKAPHAGWLREVYHYLGKLALEDGEQGKAQDYLQRSGYKNFDQPITLITPFSEAVASGHAFSPRRIAEIVPGRVYALSGFEFTEYYFVSGYMTGRILILWGQFSTWQENTWAVIHLKCHPTRRGQGSARSSA